MCGSGDEIGLVSPQGRGLVAVEERRARRGLYPITVLYSSYSGCVLAAAFSAHLALALSFFVIGMAVFTVVEYLVHRYILHGRFPDGKGWMKHVLHGVLNRQEGIAGPAGHAEHHKRPWDGNHINGHVDTVPMAVILVLLSFIAPSYTAPVLMAGILFGHLVEEWVHHAVHFWTFKSRYFEYIRRHHLYHHTPKGSEVAYGLTNGFWDTVYQTRIPEADRKLLYRRPDRRRPRRGAGPAIRRGGTLV